jgi:P27 family predicted phage terminase small subunit
MPGRKPKPTAMLKASDTFRKDRHEERLEVQGRPELPTYQSAEETFDWLVKHLDDLGVVAELDAIALQMMSDAWEDYCAARAVIKRLGPTYATTTPQGDEMHRPRPELAMMNGSWDRLKKMLPEFGLNRSGEGKAINTREDREFRGFIR